MVVSDRYAFGDFVLERSQQRVLRSDGSELSLTPRLFSALLLFVEHADALLDKDTLMQALWPGLVVEENNLSQTISGLRRALGDETPGSRYIQTVARRGFRFIAAVTELPDPPAATESVLQAEPPLQASSAPLSERAIGPQTYDAGWLVSDKRRLLRLALAIGVASGVGGMAWWALRRAPKAGLSTLAVLPFKPLVAEGRDELLEVGMADSLIARLSTVPGLVVRSIGSVRRYAGADQDPLRAARELDVAWIVDGSLQRRGDQLRVTARLLRTPDGGAAWSGSFDEKLTGVFDVQDLISARVAQVLAPTLEVGAGARTPLTGIGGTRNTDAYQLYLAAGRLAQDMRADGLRKSFALYNQALAIDPGFALAWVGLAEAHRRTLFAADALPSEVFEPAGIALQRALAIAPNLAEARAEAAFKLYWFDFDWPAAEREFRGALASNPNAVAAHFGLATLLLTQDRLDEGFAHMRSARELDPMSPVLNSLEAAYLLAAGRRDEARARLNRAFDIAPNFWLAHMTLGMLLLAEQQSDQAIAALRRAVMLADNSRASALLGIYLARSGQREEAREILNQLLSHAQTHYVAPSSLAAVHLALGEVGPALDALDRAFLSRDTRLAFLKDDPRFAGLRNEPRFIALMQKLELVRYGPGLSPP
jgi:DNA-binding winged helix-turn-helix (wHTH) protein/TolB-like protein/tetratricopeptide (TPR) repeat protein